YFPKGAALPAHTRDDLAVAAAVAVAVAAVELNSRRRFVAPRAALRGATTAGIRPGPLRGGGAISARVAWRIIPPSRYGVRAGQLR
ncbi:MAG: hypothetical protein QOI83_773, partial [Streptomycetaceae bacterium]|nr:hypothetical protein [Streptomycetaceae bacterium]